MARTTTLTVNDIGRAATELQAAGRSVTVAAVTEITGGSYTTVGRLLREWRGEAPAAPQAAADGEPLEIPAAVVRALAAVGPAVAAALAEARAEETRSREAAVSALRAEADRDRQTAAAALAEARADLDALAEQADQLQSHLDAAQARAAMEEGAARKAEAERDALARQVAALTEQLVAAKAAAASKLKTTSRKAKAEAESVASYSERWARTAAALQQGKPVKPSEDEAPTTDIATVLNGPWSSSEQAALCLVFGRPDLCRYSTQPGDQWQRLDDSQRYIVRTLNPRGAAIAEKAAAKSEVADHGARPRRTAAAAPQPRKVKGGLEIGGKTYTLMTDALLCDGERTGAYVRRQGGPATGGTVWAVGLYHRDGIAVTTHPTRADGVAAAVALLAAQS